MSQENVEDYRGLAEDFIACQTESEWQGCVERLARHLDPDVTWDPGAGLPDLTLCQGRAAVLQFWRDWLAAWETLAFGSELLVAWLDSPAGSCTLSPGPAGHLDSLDCAR
jgi:hypothetical protein